MDPIHSSPYHWIPAVSSAASIQEELAEHSGQYNTRIAGFWNTVGTLHFRDTRTVDPIGMVHYSSIPLMYFVIYVACRLLSWLGIFQKCQQKSKSICQFLQQRWQGHHFRQQELCDGQLPDKMENPCEYEQLTQNRDSKEDGSETDRLPSIGAYTNDYGSIQQ